MRVLRHVDLTLPLGPDAVVYPGDPRPRFTPASSLSEDGFVVHEVTVGSQSGTHVDAPSHVAAGGASVDRLEVGLFAGPGVLVDATAAGAGQPIGWDVFEPVAPRLGPGVLVLLHTGWVRHYGTPAWFAHPHLDPDACARVLATGVRTVLLDAPSIDPHGDDALPCHHLVADAGGVIGENLTGLDRVSWPDPFVVALPIPLTGLDGAPVRAVAFELAADPPEAS